MIFKHYTNVVISKNRKTFKRRVGRETTAQTCDWAWSKDKKVINAYQISITQQYIQRQYYFLKDKQN